MPERIQVRLALFCLSVVLISVPAALGDDKVLQGRGKMDDRSLYLRAGRIDLRQRYSALSNAESVSFDAAAYVIQLDGPMTLERRRALEAIGVIPGEYLPMYAYVVDLRQVRAEAVNALGFVRWVGEFDRSWKICPTVGTHTFESAERKQLEARGVKRLVVRLFNEADVGLAAENLDHCGAQLCGVQQRKGECLLEIDIPEGRVEELRDIAQLMFVEEASEGQPRNAAKSWIIQTNVAESRRLWDMGLLGQNQVAGIIDWNMSTTHCALTDTNPIGPNHRKILAFYGDGSGGNARHGTHVGGVLAGDDPAETDPAFRGQAPECKLVFSNQPSEITATNLYSRLELHHNDGARVHNNSWGNGQREYIAWSRDIDDFTRDFEDDLVLVAVTNPNIQVQAPENSKNVLAVAATDSTPNQGNRCFGGFGPTSDGRQKPEVWAPGCDSRSASATLQCGVDLWGGTSFAAPAVAAMGILARQYFMEGYYPDGTANAGNAFTPSGALLKAAIINSAVDMAGISGYFTANEGWGRVLMDDALFFSGDARKLIVEDVRNAAGLSTGQTNTVSFDVNSDQEPLKITLVWNDVPASLMATFAPVNNLDLVVTAPNGTTTYLGNVFDDSQSITGGSADAVNNAEQVHRTMPMTGTWTIEVVGTAVNQSTQGYALVVTGDVEPSGGINEDCNNTGVPDVQEIIEGSSQDCNLNGIPDECDIDPADPDGNGEFSFDCNDNQRPDDCEFLPFPDMDCNSNGISDDCEIDVGVVSDCNSNGIPDECDLETDQDCDGNGVLDECDVDPSDPDGDGEVLSDCNNDEVPDMCELSGHPELDCNSNGIPDECDIDDETSLDCNGNDVPDECDIDESDPDDDGEVSFDCDNDEVPDECELSGGLVDCNDNGEPDHCEIADGSSPDCNGNGIPDDCDLDEADPDGDGQVSPDCNGNNIPDACDLSESTEADCDSNGIPDSCDLTDGTSLDCNGNGIPDLCDLAAAVSIDCDGNDIPDDCDIAAGTHPDCNGNGIPDVCDLAEATSQDCNSNLIPDECDLAAGSSSDADGNGLPDECEESSPEDPPEPDPPEDSPVVDRQGLRSFLGFFFNMPTESGATIASIPANLFGLFGLQLSFTLMFLELMDLPIRMMLFEITYAFWDAVLP